MTKWIPITEQKPLEQTEVWLRFPDGQVCLGALWRRESGKEVWKNLAFVNGTPTHWMAFEAPTFDEVKEKRLWLAKIGFIDGGQGYELLEYHKRPFTTTEGSPTGRRHRTPYSATVLTTFYDKLFEVLFPDFKLSLGEVCELRIDKIEGGYGLIKVTP